MPKNNNATPATTAEDDPVVETEETVVETEETPTPANDKPSKSNPKPAECGFCVYLGPSIRANIQSATIFDTTRSEVLNDNAELIERYPLIAALIIPGDEIVTARTKVATPGNYLYNKYRQLAGQLN
jgi:hypothetical protein